MFLLVVTFCGHSYLSSRLPKTKPNYTSIKLKVIECPHWDNQKVAATAWERWPVNKGFLKPTTSSGLWQLVA